MLDIPIVKDPNIKHPRPEPKKESTNPPGWWSLRDLQGTREGLLKAIAENSEVPDHWKAALKAEIEAFPPELNFIWLDGHCHIQGGNRSYHLTIQADKALV